ncbi:hypothetical protein [uncultured Kordia sp.]|uniref:hypothetical protein n=1 Tax=uncultured Kordia sp. TaxID=507699 RepID=UPI002615EEA3|nr:hypothetical protein [uncultured Kordia sp.]
METQDELQNIFKNIESIYTEVDFEDAIMQKIKTQAKVKKQIAKNRKYGLLGVFITLILIVLFLELYDNPNLSADYRNPLIQLGMCSFILVNLFLQLETASGHSKQRIKNDS